MADTELTVTIPGWMAARLAVLIDVEQGRPDLGAVVGEILDHVQQGIYRPGAWERPWLCQALGDDWLDRVERDPDRPVFDRPRPAPPPRPSLRTRGTPLPGQEGSGQ